MHIVRGLSVAVFLLGAISADARAFSPEETERLQALFMTAVDASDGIELGGATIVADDGYIVHGDPACEISKILNGDPVCAVTAIVLPPRSSGINSIHYFQPEEIGHIDMAEWTDEVNEEIDVIWQGYIERIVEQGRSLGITVKILGWALYPTLDKERGILSYGIHLDYGGDKIVNFKAITFTRNGFALMGIIADETMMRESGHDFAAVAKYASSTYRPATGLKYADYQTGDRVAEIGVLDVLTSAMDVR